MPKTFSCSASVDRCRQGAGRVASRLERPESSGNDTRDTGHRFDVVNVRSRPFSRRWSATLNSSGVYLKDSEAIHGVSVTGGSLDKGCNANRGI